MTEPETEAATLDRLELALQRIGALARAPKPASADAALDPEIDRTAVLRALDQMIARLRNGLEPPKPNATE